MSIRERAQAELAELNALDAIIVADKTLIAQQAEAVQQLQVRLHALDETIDDMEETAIARDKTIAELKARILVLDPPPVIVDPPVGPPVVPAHAILPLSDLDMLDNYVLNFGETGRQNWNHGGHSVPIPFATAEGYWEYDKNVDPWLFDRPSTWFRMYELTGDASYYDLAVYDLEEYAQHISPQGYFDLKTSEKDTKYLYLAPFWFYQNTTPPAGRPEPDMTPYWDEVERIWKASKIGYVATSKIQDKKNWTERESWVHGETALYYFLLTGKVEGLERAKAVITQYGTGVNLVTYTAHEGGMPGGVKEDPANLTSTSSPWMSALYFQFARRMLGRGMDELIMTQAANYTDHLLQHGFYDGVLVHPNQKGFTIPRHLTGWYIRGAAAYKEEDKMHALDVLGFLHFGKWCKEQLGQNTDSMKPIMVELKRTAVDAFRKLVRATITLPKYRIQAPRSFLWWVRGRYEFLPEKN